MNPGKTIIQALTYVPFMAAGVLTSEEYSPFQNTYLDEIVAGALGAGFFEIQRRIVANTESQRVLLASAINGVAAFLGAEYSDNQFLSEHSIGTGLVATAISAPAIIIRNASNYLEERK